MPIDRPTDTPESLRALADELCALSATPDLRLTQVAAALDTAEDAIRRVADRLETPSNADELVRAIDAARRAGAEEMRAACLDLSRGCQHDLGFDREHGPIGCALDAEGRGGCMCAGLYAATKAIQITGDQP